MLNFNILESLQCVFGCFKSSEVDDPESTKANLPTPKPHTTKKKQTAYDDGLDRKIYQVSREYKISILPIIPNFDIDNLYPLTDHVELWNIFIVGNDKTYILANINDPHICLPQADQLTNHKGNNILPEELTVVFDSVWGKTLTGRQLQFYMVWNGKLYFINTYPFFNGQNNVIGAILFMRAFETMPETRFETIDGYIIPFKRSMDKGPGILPKKDGNTVSPVHETRRFPPAHHTHPMSKSQSEPASSRQKLKEIQRKQQSRTAPVATMMSSSDGTLDGTQDGTQDGNHIDTTTDGTGSSELDVIYKQSVPASTPEMLHKQAQRTFEKMQSAR